jgi:AraC-like DNA-binding protein
MTFQQEAYFYVSRQIHSWELSEDIDGYIFFCSQDFYEMHYVNQKLRSFPFFGSVNFPRKLQLTATELREIITFLCTGKRISASKRDERWFYSFTNVTDFIQATRAFSKELGKENSEVNISYFKHYQQFENLIEEHFAKEKSVAFYASLLEISSKHLNRITRTVVQKTATDVITERIILEAKRMLMYLDESLTEIAFRLGFEEYSYFVRVFRKTSGMTPTQFIKKYKA